MKTAKSAIVALAASLSVLSLNAKPQDTHKTSSNSPDSVLLNLSELEKKPVPTKRVQPLYPAKLKAAHVSGEAVITFVVDVDGSVKDARVEKTTEPAFGEAALAALNEWKFEPGRKNGAPVACQLSLPFRFAHSE